MRSTLYAAKPTVQRRVAPVVSWLERREVSPDTVTWAGLGLGALAGGLATVGGAALYAVPLVLIARVAANAVDGLLARRVGTTVRGAVLNELCDVAGDAVAYLPFSLAVTGIARPLVVVGVAIALVGEVAAIAGSPVVRRNQGPMGKSDRAAAFSLLAVAVATGASEEVVAVIAAAVAVLGVVTVHNRLRAVA